MLKDFENAARKVMNRADRKKRLIELNAPPIIIEKEVELIQKALEEMGDICKRWSGQIQRMQ